MNHKNKTIIIALLLVAVAAGCNGIGGGGSSSGGKVPFSYEGIHSGIEGIKLEFLANAPPAELLAPFKGSIDYPFKIGVKVSNKGAADVENGVLVLTVEEDYLQLDEFRKPISLKGKEIFNPLGDSSIELFGGVTKKFREGQADKYKATILATACYKYNTEAKQNMCIDTDLFDTKSKQKICSIKDITLSSQGAPVAVTKIETKIFPEGSGSGVAYVKPQYVIHIKNVGMGEIINPEADMASACSSELVASRDSEAFKNIWNIVSVSASLSEKELVCFPNPIKLRGKEDVVRCSVKDEDKIDANLPGYNAPLFIKLNYGYTSTISKEVMIIREVTY